mgnify:CR=1 FL=1
MKGFAKMARHKGPFAAIRQMQRSSPEAITVTRERLTTRYTRLYLGTASDEDFSVVATYLLYGYVLAEKAVEQDSFAEAIRELRTVKQEMVAGMVDKVRLDAVSERFEVATAMVFDLTIREQELLREHVKKKGLAMLNAIQREP